MNLLSNDAVDRDLPIAENHDTEEAHAVDRLSDHRLDELVDVIVQLASGNLKARLEPSPARDTLDALATGINLLADELDTIYQTLEERVDARTRELVEARVALERMALSDALTGLANRTLLGDRISQAMARAQRGALPPCVFLLDLDGFKTINDGLGHGAGDHILIEVARRLTAVVRETDTVARLGGDEFAILMPEATEDDALRVAERALTELHKPIDVSDRVVWTGASIGLCFALRGQSADNLLRDADTAMYAAKAKGRGNIQVFRPEMHLAASERLRVASELGIALIEDQLELHYQPVVELHTGRMVGAEALVRWNHPVRGLLMPAAFLSIAEDSGRIIELGHWVLRTVIGDLQRWAEVLPDNGFALSVNLSPIEIRWTGFADFIEATLADHGVAPHRLRLEISETDVMTGDAAGLEALVRLRNLGVGVEIDDFGTGYSSIGFLQRLPIDTVKVDRSLIEDIATESGQLAFVGAVLQLITSVGLRAVVEGIETAEQKHLLQHLGFRFGQGYVFGSPLHDLELAELLVSKRALGSAGPGLDEATVSGAGRTSMEVGG